MFVHFLCTYQKPIILSLLKIDTLNFTIYRKYTIPLFTKFAIVKLKIDFFSVSMIFFGSALRWKVSVTCSVERSLHSPP